MGGAKRGDIVYRVCLWWRPRCLACLKLARWTTPNSSSARAAPEDEIETEHTVIRGFEDILNGRAPGA